MKAHKFATAAVLGSALFVSACTDPAQYNPNNLPNNGQKTKIGAIIGGITGAIAGRSTASDSDKTKGTIVGAVVGAGAGALIGQRLDQQAQDLRESMGNQNVQIVNTGSELVVTLPQDILFAVDSASVRPDLRRDLGALAQNMMAYPDTIAQVIGHTDNTGSADYNLDLSQRRANAVADILIQNGVPGWRARATGAGEGSPVADNLTDAGRAKNRRVEIIMRPQV